MMVYSLKYECGLFSLKVSNLQRSSVYYMQYFNEYYDMCTRMSYVPGSTFCGLDLATPPSDIQVAVSTNGSLCC